MDKRLNFCLVTGSPTNSTNKCLVI